MEAIKVMGIKVMGIYDDDIFIVSYPRSGNTWLRFILASIIHRKSKIDFDNIKQYSPDLHDPADLHAIMDNNNIERPRILKTHMNYTREYNNVCYLFRDVRDVIISLYYYFLKMGSRIEFNEYFEHFISGNVLKDLNYVNPSENIGSWDESIKSWREHNDKIIMIKYEDMLVDTYLELKKILDYLDINIPTRALQKSIKNYSHDKMQRMENNARNVEYLKKNKHIKFIRKGKVGQWKSIFTEKHIELVKKKYGDLLIKLEYEKDLNW